MVYGLSSYCTLYLLNRTDNIEAALESVRELLFYEFIAMQLIVKGDCVLARDRGGAIANIIWSVKPCRNRLLKVFLNYFY